MTGCGRYFSLTPDGKPVGWPLPENRCLLPDGHDGRHLFLIPEPEEPKDQGPPRE